MTRLLLACLLALALAGPAEAAIACSSLTSGQDNSDASTYATASISPSAGVVVVVFYLNTKSSTPDLPTATGNSLTYTRRATVLFNTTSAPQQRLSVFTASGTGTAGSITFAHGGVTQTSGQWHVIECSGVDATTNDGTVQTASHAADAHAAAVPFTVTLSAVSCEDDRILAAFAIDQNPGGDNLSPEAGWTELSEQGGGNPARTSNAMWGGAGGDTTPTITLVNTAATRDIAGLAIELLASGCAPAAGVVPRRTLLGVGA